MKDTKLSAIPPCTGTIPHISICLCTFKRLSLLAALLELLAAQQTEGKFTYSIIVVDNDREGSARDTVRRQEGKFPGRIQYYIQPVQSIALARNLSVKHAAGELIAFIDDDEEPISTWLLEMYKTLLEYGADGVMGPVNPRFPIQPPRWVVKSKFFERPRYKTGFRLDWKQTGTGNVLMWRRVLDEIEGPFRSEFASGGEDWDFFRRSMAAGRVFVWCDEAVVLEIVPVERMRISFQLRRALLRGQASLASPSGTAFGVIKSFVACGIYTVLLPFFSLMGPHVLVKFLIKDFDHLGKLLALCGFSPVREKYVVK
jgi:succinoglycan biosynthesis protein ExoM